MVVRIIWILSTSKMHTAVIFPNHGPPLLCMLSCIDLSYKTIQYISSVHHSNISMHTKYQNTNKHTLRTEWCPWRLFDCTRNVSTNFSDKILPDPSNLNFLPSLSPSQLHFILSICVSLSPYSTLYYIFHPLAHQNSCHHFPCGASCQRANYHCWISLHTQTHTYEKCPCMVSCK